MSESYGILRVDPIDARIAADEQPKPSPRNSDGRCAAPKGGASRSLAAALRREVRSAEGRSIKDLAEERSMEKTTCPCA
jgi:hypothetical protein